jgi:hypothetical protein
MEKFIALCGLLSAVIYQFNIYIKQFVLTEELLRAIEAKLPSYWAHRRGPLSHYIIVEEI